jgi:tRNA-dihydrouridine synthase C
MDGITDAPMRALMGEVAPFSHAVTEFLRVSQDPVPAKVFRREVPELQTDGKTVTGLQVHVQILGGEPGRMAMSAVNAVRSGARAIDVNFGCPAPTVNRNDGGATLLKFPCRIREVVQAIREAVPADVPVSAKLRLGWNDPDEIHENAEMAVQGGASWLTIHARTRMQGYQPPVFWDRIGQVRSRYQIPVIANGDIWSREDFLRCQDATQCVHFMIGRAALANPDLPHQIASELGIDNEFKPQSLAALLTRFQYWLEEFGASSDQYNAIRFKQWLSLAAKFGAYAGFDEVKLFRNGEDILKLVSASG